MSKPSRHGPSANPSTRERWDQDTAYVPFWIGDGEALFADAELEQVSVVERHHGLDNVVHGSERGGERHLDTAPDGGLPVIQLDLQAKRSDRCGSCRKTPKLSRRMPVPGQEFGGEPALRCVGDASEHFGKPGLRIDIVKPGGADLAVHEGGALGAAIGPGEQSRLAAEGDAA